MSTSKRRGRPPLPASEAKSERVTIALRADQFSALKAWVAKQPETRPFKPMTVSEATRAAIIVLAGLPS